MQTFLLENFTSDRIKYPLNAVDKGEAIRELLEVSNGHRSTADRDELLQSLLERENLMSTGVGNGVAIPHCKSPLSPDFTLALGIHKTGIDFNSIDNEPVRIIFLLTGPEDNPTGHIRLLSRISRIISPPKTREQILGLNTNEEILNFLHTEEQRILNKSS